MGLILYKMKCIFKENFAKIFARKFLREGLGRTTAAPLDYTDLKKDEFVKSPKTVTPAEAGVQRYFNLLDSRFRGNDKNGEIATFYEAIKSESS